MGSGGQEASRGQRAPTLPAQSWSSAVCLGEGKGFWTVYFAVLDKSDHVQVQ